MILVAAGILIGWVTILLAMLYLACRENGAGKPDMPLEDVRPLKVPEASESAKRQLWPEPVEIGMN